MSPATVTSAEDFAANVLQKRVIARGGQLRFIELRCSDSEIETRLKDDSRERFGKLRDVYQFRKLDKAGAFDRPEMPNAELVMDTTNTNPLESARAIAKHLHQSQPRNPV